MVSKKINFDSSSAGIYFQIDKVKSKTNSEIFDASSLLLEDGSSNYFAAKKYGGGFGSRQNGFTDDRLLGSLKQQSIDQLDQNLFKEGNYTQAKSKKKGKTNRNENKSKDILQ